MFVYLVFTCVVILLGFGLIFVWLVCWVVGWFIWLLASRVVADLLCRVYWCLLSVECLLIL